MSGRMAGHGTGNGTSRPAAGIGAGSGPGKAAAGSERGAAACTHDAAQAGGSRLLVRDPRPRLRFIVGLFALVYLAVGLKAAWLTLVEEQPARKVVEYKQTLPRPDIVDRNGLMLAADEPRASIFAEPFRMVDVDGALMALLSVLPDLDVPKLRKRLMNRKRKFVWVARKVSPEVEQRIMALEIPGIRIRKEKKRVYPAGRLAAHVIGFTDTENKGIAGLERFLDTRGKLYMASLANASGKDAKPVPLALDARVQHALRDELLKAKEKFRALAAAGLVMDVRTGEILALASLPDFDPNDDDRREALKKDRLNRMTAGVYELGSVIKAVTFAMALEEGTASLNKQYDARFPLKIGRQKIKDYHAKKRWLSVPEIFIYSSNIGTAKMALEVGLEKHWQFLQKVGLTEKLQTELPEAARPLLPRRWSTISSATASFGHGFAVQPLQGAAVIASLVNGGLLIPPTFLKRDEETARALARRVISPATSEKMRYLFRLNAIEGTAKRAAAPGYRVGGKTGTAEKVINGRYSKDNRLTSFIGAFPMDDPKYLILVMLDDPRPLPETHGFATSGWNAVPTAGRVIARIAPLLGVAPKLDTEDAQAELKRWRRLHGKPQSRAAGRTQALREARAAGAQ